MRKFTRIFIVSHSWTVFIRSLNEKKKIVIDFERCFVRYIIEIASGDVQALPLGFAYDAFRSDSASIS